MVYSVVLGNMHDSVKYFPVIKQCCKVAYLAYDHDWQLIDISLRKVAISRAGCQSLLSERPQIYARQLIPLAQH